MRRVSKIIVTSLTVAGILVFLGFYYRPDFQRARFQKRLRERVSPSELQAWATNLFHLAYETQFDHATTTNLHPALRGLFVHDPYVAVYRADPPDSPHVSVFYGGGMIGHWGIEIGLSNRPTPASCESRRYTEWAPGVCFFDGQ